MKFITRRTALAALAAFGLAQPMLGMSQTTYPKGPVTIVVPNAPGGAVDIMARLMERQLNELWKQPVVVVYKAGANTMIGTDFVAKSAPDGLTIGLVVTSHVINPSLQRRIAFDTKKDLSGVTMLATSPVLISAYPGLKANTLAEVIAMAKKEPGRLSYASPGTGSSMHLGGELLKTLAGIDMLHAPYKGSGPAYPDVFSGRVDLIIDPLFSSMPYVKAGKLKPIAIMSAQRSPVAPNIPTGVETVPGFLVESMFGAVVPSGTPRDIVKKINADFVKVLHMPETQARMAEIGLTVKGTSPEEFDAFIASEIEKWAKVVKASGASVD
ncbi:MAG: tripartite tricarboxylate transporter substrate binding protein [Rhizobacter sp.]|jgi:tripartite-type tricarboxylate transporter receptor subunit TctC|nr:tripartite tricarboxylate transporter substrate binding protein [Rhizobacter sp.]